MQAILLSREEVSRRAKQLYEGGIRQKVELEENIGKMVIIDGYNVAVSFITNIELAVYG